MAILIGTIIPLVKDGVQLGKCTVVASSINPDGNLLLEAEVTSILPGYENEFGVLAVGTRFSLPVEVNYTTRRAS